MKMTKEKTLITDATTYFLTKKVLKTSQTPYLLQYLILEFDYFGFNSSQSPP